MQTYSEPAKPTRYRQGFNAIAGEATPEPVPENPEPPETIKPRGRTKPDLPETVYTQLPEFLQQGTAVLRGTDKDLFLLGALAALGPCLPNVRGSYAGSWTGPNIYIFVVAPAGAGKGALKWPERLFSKVHKLRRETAVRELAEWSEAAREARQNKEAEPLRPGPKTLAIPANVTKAALLEMMAANDGRGLIFESEADTLTDALKTDFGGFSDVLRKSFHGERLTAYRKGEGVFFEVERPELSVLLSGTPGQVSRLMPSAENGLFSRFLFFRFRPVPEFMNPFIEAADNDEYFETLADTVMQWHTRLIEMKEPITFELTAQQRREFSDHFQRLKDEMADGIGLDWAGLVHRRAVLSFRIMMLFTACDAFWNGDFSPRMVCDDRDFTNALRLMEALERHADGILLEIPAGQTPTKQAAALREEVTENSQLIAEARKLHREGKSYAQISRILFATETKKGTVWRWIKAQL
jgi:hypothetical protein